jgi:hypothetical protein
MRVGIPGRVVISRRIDAAARSAAEIVKEASVTDAGALGRFLQTFSGHLQGGAPATAATTSAQVVTRSLGASKPRR